MKATMAGDAGGDVELFAANHEKSAVEKASSAAHGAINSLSDKSGPAIAKAVRLAHDATDKAANAGAKSVEWMEQKKAALGTKQQAVMESTKTYVSGNPLKAMGMGLLAGAILSRIL